MTESQTETIKQLAFEGPLSSGQAIGIGIVLAILFAWSLRQEASLTRRWIAPVFWGLRLAAVAAVLWMLLGPTQLNIERSVTPKSIAILADVSLSMQVVDPPSEIEDLRWTLAHQQHDKGQLTQSCDRMLVAARAASDELQRTSRLLKQGRSAETLLKHVKNAERAVESALGHSIAILDQLASRGGAAYELAAGIENSLSESISPQLAKLSTEVEKHPAALTDASAAKMESVQSQIEGVARRSQRLVAAVTSNPQAMADSTLKRQVQRDAMRTRLEKVAQALDASEEAWRNELDESVRIRRFRFDRTTGLIAGDNWLEALASDSHETTIDSDTEPSLPATNLSAAFEQISRIAGDEQLEAVILLTDGRHTDTQSENPRDVAASAIGSLQLHVVPIGNTELARDIVIHHVEAPMAVVENDMIVVDAIVSTYQCAGEMCTVELVEGEKVLKREEIEIASDRSDHRISMATKASDLGRHTFQLRIEPLDDEADTDNNITPFGVDVIVDTIRILLADNLPRWEFRYLVNLFARDEHIDYDQLIFGPERVGSGDLAMAADLPQDIDAWSHYRLIILGDLKPDQFTQASQQALYDYVSVRGGTVVLIAGQKNMPQAFIDQPLGKLIPVEPADDYADASNGFALALSPEGRLASAMMIAEDMNSTDRVWRDMCESLPLYFVSEYSRPKPSSHTLIHAINVGFASQASDQSDEPLRAFLCWQTIGRGRVVYLAAPATYQLRMREGDKYHHRLWGQLIRWAIARDLAGGSKTVRLSTDKTRYELGEAVQVVAQLMELDGAPVSGAQLEAEAQSQERVLATVALVEDENIPGRYLARLDGLDPGSLDIGVSGDEVDRLLSTESVEGPIETPIAIDPAMGTETRDTRSDRALLNQIAEVTGGQVIPPTALAEVVRLADFSPTVHEETTRLPLWNRWTLLWLIVGCLTFEWFLRKRVGLA